jgi:mannan endo-1,4-beta-mannosidase
VLGNKSVNLLPRIFASIQRNNPGTRLAITEFDYGAPNHVSGGIALADFLGVLGRMDVYAAFYWPLSTGPFTGAAYRLYRNYDGDKNGFGTMSARATASDNALASVFASFDPGGNAVHIIVLNKSQTAAVRGNFSVATPVPITQGRVFGFEAGASAIAEKAPVASISQNSFAYDLPPLSARHFVLQTSGPLGVNFRAANKPGRRKAPYFSPGSGRALFPWEGKTALPDGRVLEIQLP